MAAVHEEAGPAARVVGARVTPSGGPVSGGEGAGRALSFEVVPDLGAGGGGAGRRIDPGPGPWRGTLCLCDLFAWRVGRTAIAPVLKTGGRKPFRVRIPGPPLDLRAPADAGASSVGAVFGAVLSPSPPPQPREIAAVVVQDRPGRRYLDPPRGPALVRPEGQDARGLHPREVAAAVRAEEEAGAVLHAGSIRNSAMAGQPAPLFSEIDAQLIPAGYIVDRSGVSW
jgi:hypothetical protein